MYREFRATLEEDGRAQVLKLRVQRHRVRCRAVSGRVTILLANSMLYCGEI
ncbi:hypothetical protein ACVW17_002765 [Bradyrhizobium sp. USDA 4473]